MLARSFERGGGQSRLRCWSPPTCTRCAADVAQGRRGELVGDEEIDVAQVADPYRRDAFELQPVGHQDGMARIVEDGAGDAHLAIVEIEQRAVLLDRRRPDDGVVDLELADEIDRARTDPRRRRDRPA
jgi:hypothetical protein